MLSCIICMSDKSPANDLSSYQRNPDSNRLQSRIRNPIKHLRWSVLQKQLTASSRLTIFAKCYILDFWQGPEYAFELVFPFILFLTERTMCKYYKDFSKEIYHAPTKPVVTASFAPENINTNSLLIDWKQSSLSKCLENHMLDFSVKATKRQ